MASMSLKTLNQILLSFSKGLFYPLITRFASLVAHMPRSRNAFAGQPQLRLQDLTSQDIDKYIDDRLVHDGMMEALAATQPEECEALVNEIGDAA